MDDNTRLALIRTLLATERNYLAIERTQLSQLRTGLSIAVIAPSAAATLTYVFSYFPGASQYEIAVYVFLSVITIFGVYMSSMAYQKLRKTRDIQKIIRTREIEIINETEFTKTYLSGILQLINR